MRKLTNLEGEAAGCASGPLLYRHRPRSTERAWRTHFDGRFRNVNRTNARPEGNAQLRVYT